MPDAIHFPRGRPDLVEVRYDAQDLGGEIDLALAEIDGALAGGLLLEVALQPLWDGAWWQPMKPVPQRKPSGKALRVEHGSDDYRQTAARIRSK